MVLIRATKHQTLNRALINFLFFYLFFYAQNVIAKEVYTLKFATLLPTGTSWTKTLDNWVKDIEQKSQGRLKFKIYPGGVMGDEPDVLRKIRKGQLHGGLFSGYGIGRIYSPARILELPFLFKNTDESDYVRSKLMPEIETGFRDNGFELLGWPEVGFIHFFSKHKIQSIDDIKNSRIWLWQGDPLGEALFAAADIKPVPLSIIDVYTQLSAKHGSIDTVYMSTFGAIALQWYSKVKYATHISVTNAIGAVVVSNKFYNKLPKDLQQLLKKSGITASDIIREQTRKENTRSKQLLIDNGIEFLWDWDTVNLDEFIAIRDKAAKHLIKSNYIPQTFFDKTRSHLEAYRQQHGDAAKQ
ncbi:TRAP-type C4-dicarboxylate transport system, periplasmic component [hydrothermal vent metagenome]|uniref:TRAP-type C4-dicarboxylate transport system, periplasmic component n=1 Tax=hydrothermal vent metagenome TaxID=652676 RepID=A0A3B0WMD9_9ZZZZ